ncbi:MAG: LysR family transcriptional regulator [Rhodovibrionaceae bacterium]|nr:LysR family transcriptional regulator [Rhodovibrionaceae bacterium]
MTSSDLERISRELDWNLLRTFMVIVEEASVTKAANRLLLSQPSVSNALKRLEGQLGRRLIERGRGEFRVTEAGELLYRECVEIYGNVSRLAVVLRDVREEISGQISIAMASHVVCPLFDRVLADFHVMHPQVTYSVEVATSSSVVQQVMQKTATFGICLVHKRQPKLDYELLFREHFGFFCGPGHRLFGKRGLSLSDLRDECFVSFRTDRLTDALRPVALLRAREQISDRIIGFSSNLEEVRRMIIAGLGIGPLPVHVVERDVRDGLLWQLPPYDNVPAIDIYVVSNPRAHLNRAETLFMEMLRERVAETPQAERIYGATPKSA